MVGEFNLAGDDPNLTPAQLKAMFPMAKVDKEYPDFFEIFDAFLPAQGFKLDLRNKEWR